VRKLKAFFGGKKHVIWDWNGTLLDDVELVVEIVGVLLEEQKKKSITPQQYRDLFCFPIVEYYRRLGFDFEKVSFETLSLRFIEAYKKGFAAMKLHPGAKELLHELRSEGYTQSVLSASQESALRKQLSHHKILECFKHVYGLTDHYAASKVERGRQLIAAAGIPAAETILVGDTDHDLEVGKEMGVDVLLLGDGHQSYERLKALHHRVLRSRR
jgi:phosphoglycolate phosphatase